MKISHIKVTQLVRLILVGPSLNNNTIFNIVGTLPDQKLLIIYLRNFNWFNTLRVVLVTKQFFGIIRLITWGDDTMPCCLLVRILLL